MWDELRMDGVLKVAIIDHQRGISSKYESSAHVALRTHRPSLLPIEWFSEIFGLAPSRPNGSDGAEKLLELDHLEEVKVVMPDNAWLVPLESKFDVD